MAKRKPKATRRSSEPPTASCLLICQDVIRGVVDHRHVLNGVVDRITVRGLPAEVGPFAAYIRLSNVYRRQEIALTFGLAGTDEEVFRIDTTAPADSDPLETHTLILKIPAFEVGQTGRYVFQATHGEVPFAQSPIQVNVLEQEESP